VKIYKELLWLFEPVMDNGQACVRPRVSWPISKLGAYELAQIIARIEGWKSTGNKVFWLSELKLRIAKYWLNERQ